MTGLVSMDIAQLEAMLKDMGQPRFRAKQVFQWLSRGERPQNMTNLPKELRSKLSDIHFDGAEIYDKFVSKKDGTIKYWLCSHFRTATILWKAVLCATIMEIPCAYPHNRL